MRKLAQVLGEKTLLFGSMDVGMMLSRLACKLLLKEGRMIERIQLALTDASYRERLRQELGTSVADEVVSVEEVDPHSRGVIVVDPGHLLRLPFPLQDPERVVLVTEERPSRHSSVLDRAWQAGVQSIVSTKDSLSVAVLAVLSARLRHSKTGEIVSHRV